jgi:hypothetical protein
MPTTGTFCLCEKKHLDTRLDHEFNKTFFSHNELLSVTFHFQQQECLSHVDIKLNKNCEVTHQVLLQASIHGDTMRAYRGSGNTTPHILTLSTTYMSAISFTLKHPLNIGLMGPIPGLGGREKRNDLSCPSRKSKQDHPTQPPHWLHSIVRPTQPPHWLHSIVRSAKTSRLCVDYGTVGSCVIIIENTKKEI